MVAWLLPWVGLVCMGSVDIFVVDGKGFGEAGFNGEVVVLVLLWRLLLVVIMLFFSNFVLSKHPKSFFQY